MIYCNLKYTDNITKYQYLLLFKYFISIVFLAAANDSDIVASVMGECI